MLYAVQRSLILTWTMCIQVTCTMCIQVTWTMCIQVTWIMCIQVTWTMCIQVTWTMCIQVTWTMCIQVTWTMCIQVTCVLWRDISNQSSTTWAIWCIDLFGFNGLYTSSWTVFTKIYPKSDLRHSRELYRQHVISWNDVLQKWCETSD